MTERNPPVWMQSGTYQGVDDRMVTGLLIDRNTDNAGTFKGLDKGVVGPLDQMKVTASGTNMNFSISGGIVIVPALSASPPGAYVCYNAGSYTGTLLAEASGNSRIDLIVAKVTDQATGGSESAWHFTVKKGNAGTAPVAVAPESDEVPIAAIEVKPASANGGVNKITSGQVTDRRQFVSGQGGVHLHWGNSPLPEASPGRLYYDVTQKSLYLYDNGAWEPLYTAKEILTLHAAYKPRMVSSGVHVQLAREDSVWDYSPQIVATPATAIQPIVIAGVKSMSGWVKVSISSYGRLNAIGGRAAVSVGTFGPNGFINYEPNGLHGLGFYSTTWEQSSTTFLVPVTADVEFTFKMAFNRVVPANDAGWAQFSNNVMVVEPVLGNA